MLPLALKFQPSRLTKKEPLAEESARGQGLRI